MSMVCLTSLAGYGETLEYIRVFLSVPSGAMRSLRRTPSSSMPVRSHKRQLLSFRSSVNASTRCAESDANAKSDTARTASLMRPCPVNDVLPHQPISNVPADQRGLCSPPLPINVSESRSRKSKGKSRRAAKLDDPVRQNASDASTEGSSSAQGSDAGNALKAASDSTMASNTLRPSPGRGARMIKRSLWIASGRSIRMGFIGRSSSWRSGFEGKAWIGRLISSHRAWPGKSDWNQSKPDRRFADGLITRRLRDKPPRYCAHPGQ